MRSGWRHQPRLRLMLALHRRDAPIKTPMAVVRPRQPRRRRCPPAQMVALLSPMPPVMPATKRPLIKLDTNPPEPKRRWKRPAQSPTVRRSTTTGRREQRRPRKDRKPLETRLPPQPRTRRQRMCSLRKCHRSASSRARTTTRTPPIATQCPTDHRFHGEWTECDQASTELR